MRQTSFDQWAGTGVLHRVLVDDVDHWRHHVGVVLGVGQWAESTVVTTAMDSPS